MGLCKSDTDVYKRQVLNQIMHAVAVGNQQGAGIQPANIVFGFQGKAGITAVGGHGPLAGGGEGGDADQAFDHGHKFPLRQFRFDQCLSLIHI